MGIFRAGRALALQFASYLIAITAAFPLVAWAQMPTPTPEQIEMFRSLPPDQQQQLLEALGRGQLGGLSISNVSGLGDASPPQETAESITRRRQQARQDEQKKGAERIAGGAMLILDVELQLGAPTNGLAAERRDRIRAGNPYRLDNEGRLSLPSMPPINLSGLTSSQAAQRLNYDPRLAGLRFTVTLLPVEPVGTEALQPFGYDLFDEVPSAFAADANLPVPTDYRLGPGDSIIVEFFGNRTGRYYLSVDRNGTLTLPQLGPLQAAGLTFDQLRRDIDQRVSEQLVGARATVTMGELRSIRIFVVGDVMWPGSYTVSSLSTITNALFASGGISKIGSLRNVELKRAGKTVAKLDLYDLLLKGDTSQDLQLESGDAIFVAPIGSTAGIGGQVRRPAIYEFHEGATVEDLLALSGGLKPEADPRRVSLERIGPDRERVVIELDLSDPADRAQRLAAGDLITVPMIFEDVRGITLEGHVHRAGNYAWREGMRLTDLLGTPQVFKLNADQRYVLIRRESLPDRRVHVVSADAVRAFERPGTSDDPLLMSGDRVIVFNRSSDRGPALTQILDELRMQTRDNDPTPIVSVSGRVRAPGEYPLEPGMTVGDLIRAGGGLDDAAYAATAELTRYAVVDEQVRKTDVIDLELAAAAAGDQGANIPLQPYDVLVVRETPDWRGQEAITITGEVRFPGTYPIRKGETLSSVIARAGGLTDAAFPKGSVFLREELKEQERQQVESLVNRLQADLAALALQSAQGGGSSAAGTLQAGQSLLAQLQSVEPTGRLVINLPKALANAGGEDDVELRGGDKLMIPRMKQYVTVIGEVQNPTAHVFKSGLSRDDYISLSGGTTQRADEKRTYVVRADGSVVAASNSPYWFRRGTNVELEPGDTVVVPLDAERMRPLALWTSVTTIIYNLAVTLAAISSI